MTEVTTRPIDGNGHVPDTPHIGHANFAGPISAALPLSIRCPYSRHFSIITGEYSISLDYAGFDRILGEVYDLWDAIPECDEKTGDRFEALLNNICAMQAWTGWDGVPAEYLTEEKPS